MPASTSSAILRAHLTPEQPGELSGDVVAGELAGGGQLEGAAAQAIRYQRQSGNTATYGFDLRCFA